MNMKARIAIVAVLCIVVAIVIANKRSTDDDPHATGQPHDTDATKHLPRLVDIGGSLCMPCKLMEPVIEEIRTEYAGRLRVDFYDGNKYPKYKKQFSVKGLPTQIIFDADGKEIWRNQGFAPKAKILGKFKTHGIDLDATAASPK